MRAVLLGADGKEYVGEVPDPVPAPDEVVLRVDYCGICGSDLHAAHQGFAVGVALGHEFAGEVIEIGSEITSFAVGDRVCVNPNGDWCGRCGFCRAGQYDLCTELFRTAVSVARNGGMVPFAAVPAKVLHRLPDGVPTKQGAWVEPLATAPARSADIGYRHGRSRRRLRRRSDRSARHHLAAGHGCRPGHRVRAVTAARGEGRRGRRRRGDRPADRRPRRDLPGPGRAGC